MTQHELSTQVRAVREYELDTLGAPFKVILHNSVTLSIEPKSGKELVHVPDVAGLICAVVRSRVMHSRKLNGKEIKFIRNSLGVRAKDVAKALEMSAEHYSRCEAGMKAMASLSERYFRLLSFWASSMPDPEEWFSKCVSAKSTQLSAQVDELPKSPQNEKLLAFIQSFFSINIQAAFSPDDVLRFDFVRSTKSESSELPLFDKDNEGGEWMREVVEAA